jgi:hypothetical protein
MGTLEKNIHIYITLKYRKKEQYGINEQGELFSENNNRAGWNKRAEWKY